MYGWDTTNKLIRIHVKQLIQEAERDRLVKVATFDSQPVKKPLTEQLGRALIQIGSRLIPNEPDPLRGISVQPVSAGCCEIVAGQCVPC